MKSQSDFNRNAFKLMTGNAFAQAIPVAISPLLTRLFTPEDFGILALFTALIATLGSVAHGRYDLAIMLPGKDRDARNIVALGTILSALVSTAFLIFALFGGEWFAQQVLGVESYWWLYLAPVGIFLVGFFSILNFYNSRLGNFGQIAYVNVAKTGSTAGIHIGTGLVTLGSAGLVAGRIVGELMSVISMIVISRRKGKLTDGVTRSRMLAVARKYIDFPRFSMWSIFSNKISYHSTEVFISSVFSVATLGQYALVQHTLAGPSAVIGTSVGQVFFQQAAEERRRTGKAVESFNHTFLGLLVIAVSGFGILYFIAEELFSFVFGEQWRIAGEYTKLLVPLFIVRFIASPISVINSVFEKQKMAFFWQIGLLLISLLLLLFTYLSDGGIKELLTNISVFLSAYYCLWLVMMHAISRGRL